MRKRGFALKNILLLLSALTLGIAPAVAQTPTQMHAPQAVPVIMLSDIHLDPLHDPAKFAALRSAPVEGWAAILEAPASRTQQADFDKLQTTCGANGVDTSMDLFRSALAAAQKQQPRPLFVTVSGDLMAHKFSCRFHTLAPTGTAAEYSAFAAKTVAFVALQLHQAFPQSPVYFALGNNDSGCEDYREDPGSAFLKADAASFAADVLNPHNRRAVLSEFPKLGDYTVTLPEPMVKTRLIVLQDIFQSQRYAGCNGAGSAAPAAEQIAWLRAQLAAARAAREHVWVMAHIPPGVNAYATITKNSGICNGQQPEMFLQSDEFANAIAAFPDTIRLVLLGHTHMDEMRMYKTPGGTIPGKLIPSITPVDGNDPSFTIAQIEPTTAGMRDYAVFAASNMTGVGTAWNQEYIYSARYHMPDYSGDSAAKLASIFLADKNGSSPDSSAYQRLFFAGRMSISEALKTAAMQIVWPAYACTMTNAQSASFLSCACSNSSGR